jgi:hypothetical protein
MTTKIRFEVLMAVKDGKDFNKVCTKAEERLKKVVGVKEVTLLVAWGNV